MNQILLNLKKKNSALKNNESSSGFISNIASTIAASQHKVTDTFTLLISFFCLFVLQSRVFCREQPSEKLGEHRVPPGTAALLHSSVRLHNSYFQFRSSSVSETLSDSRLRCPVRQVGIKFSRLHMKALLPPPPASSPRAEPRRDQKLSFFIPNFLHTELSAASRLLEILLQPAPPAS